MKFADMLNQLRRDRKMLIPVAWTFFTRGIAAFGTLALSLALARYSNATELGLFMTGLSIIVGVGILSRFGMDNAMLRFGAIAARNRDLQQFIELQRKALLVSVLASLFFSMILIIFGGLISVTVFSNPALAHLMLPLALVLPAYSLIYMQGTWLKTLNRPAYAPLFETGAVAFITAASIVMGAMLGNEITAVSVAYYLLFSTLIVLIGGQFTVNRVKRSVFMDPTLPLKSECQKSVFTVLPDFVLISMTAYSVQWGALLILSAYEESDQVGLYSTVHRLAFVVNFILMVFNSVLAPRFASLYKSGEHKKLDILVRKSTLYMTAFSTPLALLLFAFPSFWLSLFGDEFAVAAPILMILVIAQLINVATGSVGFLLNMTGHQKDMRNIVLMTGAVTIGLSFFFIPMLGIWGALISNATALILQNLVAAYKVNKLLGIRTIPGWDAFR